MIDLTDLTRTVAALVASLPTPQVPNPPAGAPPGSDKILTIIGYIKWAAGAALITGFFAGVVVFAGGRWIDHHRAGRVGTTMILASMFGALLYGIGYTMISSFAGG
jgi:hypothetical protein